MSNYKIVISYDGTRYKGWQSQKSTDATIQGKLQDILKKTAGYPVEVIGSGRTDAGVHAKGQVANFHLKEQVDERKLLETLNHYLPEDIAVLSLEEVEERFHSRFQAKEKTYMYRLYTSKIQDVFERKYVYTYTEPLHLENMRKAAAYMTGTMDFTSFCANKHMKKSAVRSVYAIDIQVTEKEIDIIYRGNGFLQNMVRIMTGTLLEVGMGKKKPEDIPMILAAKNREAAGFTAPAQGLVLLEVKYD